MLSSVNPFGGLSSFELMTLFGQKSASSPLNATSKTPAQPAVTGASALSANNPANAIQAILAQAQIDKTDIEQALTPASGTAAGGGSTAATSAQPESAAPVSEVTEGTYAAYATQTAGGSTSGITSTTADQRSDGQSWLVSESVTNVTTASGSVDTFQMTVSADAESVTVGFSVAGLGAVTQGPGGVISVGQGDLTEGFQIGVGVVQSNNNAWAANIWQMFSIGGLDAAQEQQVSAAFQEATSGIEAAVSPGYFLNILQISQG